MTGDEPLPGLEPPAHAAGEVEAAARRTIAALERDGLLDERHALPCQMLLALARTMEQAKPYAVANIAAQLRELLESLPAPKTGGEGQDAWAQLAADLRTAASRDTTEPRPA